MAEHQTDLASGSIVKGTIRLSKRGKLSRREFERRKAAGLLVSQPAPPDPYPLPTPAEAIAQRMRFQRMLLYCACASAVMWWGAYELIFYISH